MKEMESAAPLLFHRAAHEMFTRMTADLEAAIQREVGIDAVAEHRDYPNLLA
jgi:hypothetical protein